MIRVPGIGLKTARKILEKRPIRSEKLLKSLGVDLKKAIPFIEFNSQHSRLSAYF